MTNAAIASAVDFIRWFDEIGIDDVTLVGGKNASWRHDKELSFEANTLTH